MTGAQIWKYTLSGDTMETASRMQRYSLPCRIQCSQEFTNALSRQNQGINLMIRRVPLPACAYISKSRVEKQSISDKIYCSMFGEYGHSLMNIVSAFSPCKPLIVLPGPGFHAQIGCSNIEDKFTFCLQGGRN